MYEISYETLKVGKIFFDRPPHVQICQDEICYDVAYPQVSFIDALRLGSYFSEGNQGG